MILPKCLQNSSRSILCPKYLLRLSSPSVSPINIVIEKVKTVQSTISASVSVSPTMNSLSLILSSILCNASKRLDWAFEKSSFVSLQCPSTEYRTGDMNLKCKSTVLSISASISADSMRELPSKFKMLIFSLAICQDIANDSNMPPFLVLRNGNLPVEQIVHL